MFRFFIFVARDCSLNLDSLLPQPLMLLLFHFILLDVVSYLRERDKNTQHIDSVRFDLNNKKPHKSKTVTILSTLFHSISFFCCFTFGFFVCLLVCLLRSSFFFHICLVDLIFPRSVRCPPLKAGRLYAVMSNEIFIVKFICVFVCSLIYLVGSWIVDMCVCVCAARTMRVCFISVLSISLFRCCFFSQYI